MDFPCFFISDFPDDLRKSKFLIVQGNFVRLLMSYREIMFLKRLSGRCQVNKDLNNLTIPTSILLIWGIAGNKLKEQEQI